MKEGHDKAEVEEEEHLDFMTSLMREQDERHLIKHLGMTPVQAKAEAKLRFPARKDSNEDPECMD